MKNDEEYIVTILEDGRCVDVRFNGKVRKWLATCNAIPKAYFWGETPKEAVDGLLYVESVGVDELIRNNGRQK